MKSQVSPIFPPAQCHLLKLLSPSKQQHQQHQLFKYVFKYTGVQGHEPVTYILYSNHSILSLPLIGYIHLIIKNVFSEI